MAQKSSHTYDAPLLFLSYKSCILLVSLDRYWSRIWPAVDRYAAARDSFVPLKHWELPQALEPLTCARKDTMAEDAGGLDLWCFLMDVVRYPISNVVWIIRKELYTYRSHLESLAKCFGHFPKCPESWSLENVPLSKVGFLLVFAVLYAYLLRFYTLFLALFVEHVALKRWSAFFCVELTCRATQKWATRPK